MEDNILPIGAQTQKPMPLPDALEKEIRQPNVAERIAKLHGAAGSIVLMFMPDGRIIPNISPGLPVAPAVMVLESVKLNLMKNAGLA
jgi:hypothetical protein